MDSIVFSVYKYSLWDGIIIEILNYIILDFIKLFENEKICLSNLLDKMVNLKYSSIVEKPGLNISTLPWMFKIIPL